MDADFYRYRQKGTQMGDYSVKETSYGTIKIGTYAIGALIVKIVDSFHGQIHLSNKKGRMVAWMNKISDSADIDNMEISFDAQGRLDIVVYVIIRFGQSISRLTNELLDQIEEQTTLLTGSQPHSLSVVVTGMLSKNIARRHIEVSRYHEDS